MRNKEIDAAVNANQYFLAAACPMVPVKEGKKPMRSWKGITSTTALEVEGWASDRSLRQATGLALLTGPNSGTTVLDEDEPGAVKALFARAGIAIPPTAMAKSPRGTHYYFAHDPRLSNSAKLVPGVDVRSGGGIIVLPGSLGADGLSRYSWSSPPELAGLANLPDPVVELLAHAAAVPALAQGPAAPRASKRRLSPRPVESTAKVQVPSPACRALLKRLRGDLAGVVVPEGVRDSTIFAYALDLHARGVNKPMAEALLKEVNARCCQPRLTPQVIMQKLNSAYSRPRHPKPVGHGPEARRLDPAFGVPVAGKWIYNPLTAGEEARLLCDIDGAVEVLTALREMQQKSMESHVRYSWRQLKRRLPEGYATRSKALWRRVSRQLLGFGLIARRPTQAVRGQALLARWYELKVAQRPRPA